MYVMIQFNLFGKTYYRHFRAIIEKYEALFVELNHELQSVKVGLCGMAILIYLILIARFL